MCSCPIKPEALDLLELPLKVILECVWEKKHGPYNKFLEKSPPNSHDLMAWVEPLHLLKLLTFCFLVCCGKRSAFNPSPVCQGVMELYNSKWTWSNLVILIIPLVLQTSRAHSGIMQSPCDDCLLFISEPPSSSFVLLFIIWHSTCFSLFSSLVSISVSSS